MAQSSVHRRCPALRWCFPNDSQSLQLFMPQYSAALFFKALLYLPADSKEESSLIDSNRSAAEFQPAWEPAPTCETARLSAAMTLFQS